MNPEPGLTGVGERQRPVSCRRDIGAGHFQPLYVGDGVVILPGDGGAIDGHGARARSIEIGRDLGVD